MLLHGLGILSSDYWKWGSDPNTLFGNQYPAVGWIGEHGEFVAVLSSADVAQAWQNASDVGPSPDFSHAPAGAVPPPVPLQYQTSVTDAQINASTQPPVAIVAQANVRAGYTPLIANNPGYWTLADWFDPSYPQDLLGFAIDPNRRSVIIDLRAAGLSDADILHYAQLAESADPLTSTATDQPWQWARAYVDVINQLAKDHPDIAKQLYNAHINADVWKQAQDWANSRAKQISEIGQSPFDKFMQNYAPYLFVAIFAVAAVAAAGAAAGAGTATTTTAATSGIDAATAAQIGAGWESAAATSALQNAALAAAAGDTASYTALVSAVGQAAADTMVADAAAIAGSAGALTTAVASAAPGTAAPEAAALPASTAPTAAPATQGGLLQEAGQAIGTAKTAIGYGSQLYSLVTGKQLLPTKTAKPSGAVPIVRRAPVAQTAGKGNNFPLILGAIGLFAIVKLKGF